MVNPIRLVPLACLLAVTAAACTGINGPEDQALEITLTASPTTATVGAPIEFRFEARGNSLDGVALSYGDGVIDSIPTYQARTAGGVYNHGYTDAGEYAAVVTVVETGGDIAIDSVRVTINSANGQRQRHPVVLTSRASRVN